MKIQEIIENIKIEDIKKIRLENNLKIKDMAEELNLVASTYSMYEKGERSLPNNIKIIFYYRFIFEKKIKKDYLNEIDILQEEIKVLVKDEINLNIILKLFQNLKNEK